MHTYEIEIKTLLGSDENKEAFVSKLMALEGVSEKGSSSQLNHYFVDGDLQQVHTALSEVLSTDRLDALQNIIDNGTSFSVRTRQMNDQVIFVVKASIDETTSENGISRIEFEETLDSTLAEVDQVLLDAGFEYQAKWSRDRVEYQAGDVTICLDRNAGYGYLAEFEMVVDDPEMQDDVKEKLYGLMSILEVEELDQERLARMFEHYNQNWADYYGTDNVFTIE